MLNEKISETYSKIYNIPFIGLRFFTIFGEWGRPDMFLFKLFKSYFNKDTFYLNNFGNHERDFTYIDDVTNMLVKLTLKKNKGHKVFNISSNNPINIKNIINNFTKSRNIKLKKIEKNKADMLKTHGDNKKILNYLNIKLNKNFEKNFLNTFNWYSKNYKNKHIN